MAFDETLAARLRADLAQAGAVDERRMFGGLAFMVAGHMVCGVHKGGAMFRCGKDRQSQALAVAGTRIMEMGGRQMPGMIAIGPDGAADPARRARLLALALETVRSLPPK